MTTFSPTKVQRNSEDKGCQQFCNHKSHSSNPEPPAVDLVENFLCNESLELLHAYDDNFLDTVIKPSKDRNNGTTSGQISPEVPSGLILQDLNKNLLCFRLGALPSFFERFKFCKKEVSILTMYNLPY